MTLQVAVVGAQRIGAVPHGTRITFPIIGGSFEGDRLRGKGTADAKYSFLNRLLAIGIEEIGADGPVHVIEEIL